MNKSAEFQIIKMDRQRKRPITRAIVPVHHANRVQKIQRKKNALSMRKKAEETNTTICKIRYGCQNNISQTENSQETENSNQHQRSEENQYPQQTTFIIKGFINENNKKHLQLLINQKNIIL